jgi:aspartyl protease family protein
MRTFATLGSVVLALVAAPASPRSSLPPVDATMPMPAVAKAPGLVVQRAADGLFYVEAQINGRPVTFVVDSGSSVVVLSAADAARADVTIQDNVRAETAGGAAAMRRADIAHVVLAGRTLTHIDAAVVDRGLPVSLLGQSALSQLASVTFSGDRLEFH